MTAQGPMPPFFPIHLERRSAAVKRAGTTIGHIVTQIGEPAPSAGATRLDAGTLWIDTGQLGASSASPPRLVGMPFASATLRVTGPAIVPIGGDVELDSAATLTLTLTSRIAPGPAATAGQAVSADFLSATLT